MIGGGALLAATLESSVDSDNYTAPIVGGSFAGVGLLSAYISFEINPNPVDPHTYASMVTKFNYELAEELGLEVEPMSQRQSAHDQEPRLALVVSPWLAPDTTGVSLGGRF